MTIARILATKGGRVVTIGPEQTVREALALLVQHNIGALVVAGAAGAPQGIVSERDIVRAAARDEDLFGRPVRTIMTAPVITASPQDDLQAVAHTMTERRIRHLPVVEHGALVGMVSIGDVVKAERDEYQGQADTMRTQLLAD